MKEKNLNKMNIILKEHKILKEQLVSDVVDNLAAQDDESFKATMLDVFGQDTDKGELTRKIKKGMISVDKLKELETKSMAPEQEVSEQTTEEDKVSERGEEEEDTMREQEEEDKDKMQEQTATPNPAEPDPEGGPTPPENDEDPAPTGAPTITQVNAKDAEAPEGTPPAPADVKDPMDKTTIDKDVTKEGAHGEDKDKMSETEDEDKDKMSETTDEEDKDKVSEGSHEGEEDKDKMSEGEGTDITGESDEEQKKTLQTEGLNAEDFDKLMSIIENQQSELEGLKSFIKTKYPEFGMGEETMDEEPMPPVAEKAIKRGYTEMMANPREQLKTILLDGFKKMSSSRNERI